MRAMDNYWMIGRRRIMKSKRASIPVTVFVILTIALFAFTLLAFSVTKTALFNNIGKKVSFVEDFNLKAEGKRFLGQPDLVEDAELGQSKFIGVLPTGDKFDLIRIKKIRG